MNMSHPQRGSSLLISIIALALISSLSILLSKFSNEFRSSKAIQRNSEVEGIRRHILNHISCAHTLAATGGACSGLVDIYDRSNNLFIPRTGKKFGYWTLVGECLNQGLHLKAAVLRPGFDATASDPQAFGQNPLTKTVMNWTLGTSMFALNPKTLCEDSGEIYTYRTPGSYTLQIPLLRRNVIVEVWGGGGGGGASRYIASNLRGHGSGGGGGGYARGEFSVLPGDTLQIVIGNGGGGAPSSPCPGGRGSSGGTSSVTFPNGSSIVGGGGEGGESQDNDQPPFPLAGVGGQASGGAILINGSRGQAGSGVRRNWGVLYVLGRGGKGGLSYGTSPGTQVAAAPGGGGGGGQVDLAPPGGCSSGYDGAAGMVIVRVF